MTEPLFKKKLKADELEALIMKRLDEHEECAGIVQVTSGQRAVTLRKKPGRIL